MKFNVNYELEIPFLITWEGNLQNMSLSLTTKHENVHIRFTWIMLLLWFPVIGCGYFHLSPMTNIFNLSINQTKDYITPELRKSMYINTY